MAKQLCKTCLVDAFAEKPENLGCDLRCRRMLSRFLCKICGETGYLVGGVTTNTWVCAPRIRLHRDSGVKGNPYKIPDRWEVLGVDNFKPNTFQQLGSFESAGFQLEYSDEAERWTPIKLDKDPSGKRFWAIDVDVSNCIIDVTKATVAIPKKYYPNAISRKIPALISGYGR